MGRNRVGEQFESVLLAAQAGGGWAAERIWLAYAGPVAGYLRLQGVADAEDLTSEVFLGMLRSIGSFDGDEAAFRSWLFTIAHRRLLDHRRGSARRPQASSLDKNTAGSLSPVEPGAGPESSTLERLATERVTWLCRQLSADQRDVLLLRLVLGATVEEVAASVGRSTGAVKALQRRGLANLRSLLEREGVPL